MIKYDAIIIGAGISGLLAAGKLQEHGENVLIIDKSRGVGGRMATRRIDDYRFDHGAQSIQLNENRLAIMKEKWKSEGIVTESRYSLYSDSGKGNPVHCLEGITQLPKYLARNLQIINNWCAEKVSYTDSVWSVISEKGESYIGTKLIFTCPIPQALVILKHSSISLPNGILQDLHQISYAPCIALMGIVETSGVLISDVIKKVTDETVNLIVDNFAKGVSSVPGAVTLLCNRRFSETNWAISDNELQNLLLSTFTRFIPIKPHTSQIHRWLYSEILNEYPAPFLVVKSGGVLGFAGDGFSGKGVEGAAISGLELAEAILTLTS